MPWPPEPKLQKGRTLNPKLGLGLRGLGLGVGV